MKIIEARDGFIKVETAEQLQVSSFLSVKGIEKNYIAQIIQVKNSGTGYILYAKLLFLYDITFTAYDKTLPNASAEVEVFPFENISKIYETTKSVTVGRFADTNSNIAIDKSNFGSMLVSVDSPKLNNDIVQLFSKQFANIGKTFIIDMLGIVEGEKYVAGVDFKLPLNADSLSFIYEDCLNDATSDSKTIIKGIFNDLAEYSVSVPFVPFGALKTIVDEMVEKAHEFKLLVLKNKLAKFDKLGYFASTKTEADKLSSILAENRIVIDLSKLDTLFQNRYLSVILNMIDNLNVNAQLFVECSNSVNKKNLKSILKSEAYSSVLITHSKFKYLNDIKSMFKNFVVENTFSNKEVFKLYTPFLNSVGEGSYLVVGAGTNHIPLISSAEGIEVATIEEQIGTFAEELQPETPVADEAVEEESEESLVEPAESFTDTDESIEAIDKKSDELIQKTTEELEESEQSEELDIFSDDDDDDDDDTLSESIDQEPNLTEDVELSETEPEEVEATESDIITSDEVESVEVQDVVSVENDETVLDEKDSFEHGEFHTVVDTTKVMDLPSVIDESKENIEQEDKEDKEDEIIVEPEEEEIVEYDDNQQELIEESISSDDSSDIIPLEESENTELINDIEEPELITESSEEISEEINLTESGDLTEETVNEADDDFEEIVDISEADLGDDTIMVEMDDSAEDEELILDNDDSSEQEIIEDVDKVYTTIKDDTISEADLDFIDELNEIDDTELSSELENSDEENFSDNGMELLEELPSDDEQDEFLQPIEEFNSEPEHAEDEKSEVLETKSAPATTVPVYDAEIPQEDRVVSDPIEQGDSVVHAKYGNGVVEKMIKYGTKELYSINFDNVGRRLLDPTLTEIKKA